MVPQNWLDSKTLHRPIRNLSRFHLTTGVTVTPWESSSPFTIAVGASSWMLGVFSMDNSSGKPKQNICDGANTRRLTLGEHATIPPVSYTNCMSWTSYSSFLGYDTRDSTSILPVSVAVPFVFFHAKHKTNHHDTFYNPAPHHWGPSERHRLRWSINPLTQNCSNIFIGSHILWGRSSKNSASTHITRRSLFEIFEMDSPKKKSCQMQWKAGPINFHKPSYLTENGTTLTTLRFLESEKSDQHPIQTGLQILSSNPTFLGPQWASKFDEVPSHFSQWCSDALMKKIQIPPCLYIAICSHHASISYLISSSI